LNEFINVVNLIGDPELTFGTDVVILKNGRQSASYRFADTSILTAPTKSVTMPEAEVEVTITNEILGQVRKAAGVLGHTNVSLRGKNGTIELVVIEPRSSTGNTFSITLDENNACKDSFDLQFLISNLKVLAGDYLVRVSSKLISHWTSTTTTAEYYITLEKTSSYGGDE